jgi:hypothetical protein
VSAHVRDLVAFVLCGLSAAVLAGSTNAGGEDLRTTAREFVILQVQARTPSTVGLAIIVLDSGAAADAALGELAAGSPFEVVARARSTHPTANDGGKFGVFALVDLSPEFVTALDGVPAGGHTRVVEVSTPEAPSGWPAHVPVPGAPLRAVETALGRADSEAKVLPGITELTYDFGLRLRVNESRGLGFLEFGDSWLRPIFGIQIDEPMPQAELDTFSRAPRFARGVFVGLPAHPHWFVDVDDRVDEVRRLLFIDPNIYGSPSGIPGVP